MPVQVQPVSAGDGDAQRAPQKGYEQRAAEQERQHRRDEEASHHRLGAEQAALERLVAAVAASAVGCLVSGTVR